MDLGWFDARSFDIEAYDALADPDTGGDVHRICPKFVAFRGPEDMQSNSDDDTNSDYCAAHTPAQYVPVLSALQVARWPPPCSVLLHANHRARIALIASETPPDAARVLCSLTSACLPAGHVHRAPQQRMLRRGHVCGRWLRAH
eukprot:3680111-Rhodomonas_salina.1